MAFCTNALPGRRVARHRRQEAGFSLIELLVAMLVMTIVLAAIYAIWFGLQRTYAFTEDDMNAQQEARNALNEMVELLRTARQPDDDDIAELTSASSADLDMILVYGSDTEIIFWSDVDRDAAHDLELIRFAVKTDERTLWRDVSQTGDRNFTADTTSVRLVGRWLSNDSSLPLFEYKTGADQTIATPLDAIVDLLSVRQIAITLAIDIDVEKRPIRHRLSTVVQPRNLRSF